MNDGKWELRLHESVKKNIEDMDTSIRNATKKGLQRLTEAPVERSKQLTGSLKKARTFRFGTPSGEYRALIRLNRQENIVKVYYVGSREGFYETIRRIFE